MTLAAFDADEGAPEWMLRRKKFSADEPGTLAVSISTGNLRGKRQKQLIQVLLRKEIAHQLRPTLDQNDLTLLSMAHRLQYGTRTERTGAGDRRELN